MISKRFSVYKCIFIFRIFLSAADVIECHCDIICDTHLLNVWDSIEKRVIVLRDASIDRRGRTF